MDSCALSRRVLDRIDDVRICAAAAKIAAHPLTNFIVALHVSFFDAGHSGTNLSRRAVAALKTVMLHERCLDWMQLLAVRQTFDRGDFLAVMNNRETQTGINSPAIHQHCAGAALAMIASFARAGEVQLLAHEF